MNKMVDKVTESTGKNVTVEVKSILDKEEVEDYNRGNPISIQWYYDRLFDWKIRNKIKLKFKKLISVQVKVKNVIQRSANP